MIIYIHDSLHFPHQLEQYSNYSENVLFSISTDIIITMNEKVEKIVFLF